MEATNDTVINTIKDNLNVTIKDSDISISHRLGKQKQQNNRPIIVKLANRSLKQDLVGACVRTKPRNLYINESGGGPKAKSATPLTDKVHAILGEGNASIMGIPDTDDFTRIDLYNTVVASGAAQLTTSQSIKVVDEKVEKYLPPMVIAASMWPSSGVEASLQPIVVEKSLPPSVSAAPTFC
ncbi:uncharacterized protein LOC123502498 [Portunus trituberculatus]|uniref:uncharacterized protein LOC123502498 n=1 Tax=Portunus trituberculatus TaxID=210409 RepID=UPI001E1CD313|nr:uncharacterized protein LOC123502498 [Portunus trituberculatus]